MLWIILGVLAVLFVRNHYDVQGVKKDLRGIARTVRKAVQELIQAISQGVNEAKKEKAAEKAAAVKEEAPECLPGSAVLCSHLQESPCISTRRLLQSAAAFQRFPLRSIQQ